jgi:hypothetical protein
MVSGREYKNQYVRYRFIQVNVADNVESLRYIYHAILTELVNFHNSGIGPVRVRKQHWYTHVAMRHGKWLSYGWLVVAFY